MKVKVCGIRRYEDARTALDEGAWALGFIFHAPSPRFVRPDDATAIVRRLPAEALTIGVFVDWPLEDLNAAVAAAGLRGAQLHGSEGPEYARGVRAELVVKALRLAPGFRPEVALEFPGCSILIDAYRPGVPGGTGATADWGVARRVAELAPIILAGGISRENAAAAIEAVRPDALDVSSGVESAPGVKDPDRIRALLRAVRELG